MALFIEHIPIRLSNKLNIIFVNSQSARDEREYTAALERVYLFIIIFFFFICGSISVARVKFLWRDCDFIQLRHCFSFLAINMYWSPLAAEP